MAVLHIISLVCKYFKGKTLILKNLPFICAPKALPEHLHFAIAKILLLLLIWIINSCSIGDSSVLSLYSHLFTFVHIIHIYLIFFSALDEMKNHLENPKNMIEMKFLLLEQKFLELISKGNRMNALKVSV